MHLTILLCCEDLIIMLQDTESNCSIQQFTNLKKRRKWKDVMAVNHLLFIIVYRRQLCEYNQRRSLYKRSRELCYSKSSSTILFLTHKVLYS